MKHTFKRRLSLILAVVMIIGMLPALTAFAAEETSATISFASTAQRVSQDASAQVWQNGGLTMTNSKGTSTSNVANYSNPVRIYANSTVQIEFANMNKFVITSDATAKYISALQTSVNSIPGATVTVSSNVVTVELADPVDSVSFTASAQIRFKDLTAYGTEATGTDHTCTEGEPVIENNVPPTCTTPGSYDTVIRCADETCGKVISRVTTDVPALGHNYVDGVCSVCGQPDPSTGVIPSATVSTTIADYADAKLWENSKAYLEILLDDYITVAAVANDKTFTNTGKYYTNGENWRIYQGENPSIVISGNYENVVITSVTITYSPYNTGVLQLNGVDVESGVAVPVNANSVTFGVGNTGTATNGQVRITAIEVSYCDISAAPSCNHANTTVEGKSDATCVADGYTGNTVCSDCGVTVAAGETIPATGHNFVDGVCANCSFAFTAPEAVEPADGDAFKAVVYQLNIPKKLYFTGTMSGNYLATTENEEEAATIYAEAVEGGFKLYFLNGDVKTYIDIYEYTTGKVGIQLSETDGVVFVMDADANTPVTKDAIVDNQWYLGCYSGYATISASKTTYITGDNAAKVDVSQFPMRLVAVVTEEEPTDPTVPSEPEVTDPTTPSEPEVTDPTTPSEPTTAEDPNAKFAQTGLALGEFIGLQNAIMKSALNAKDFDEAYYIYKHHTFDADGNAIVVDGQGEFIDMGSYFVADCKVNAKQMADVFEITPVYVKDGVTYYGVTAVTSVKEQAMVKVNSTATDDKSVKTAAICVAMLNYGAEAQKSFKYNQGNLANSELNTEQKTLPAFADLNLVKTNTIPTTPFKPAQSGMQLGDVVYMQFLVAKSNVDAAGVLTYTIGSEDAVEIAVADLETYNSYYLINIPIKAKNVRTDISVSFTAENYTMTCSIEAFAVAKEGSATETLVAALMAYGDATAALFN